MRLSGKYQRTIKQKAAEWFGKDVKVYLFGSRMDDARRGGDIDLLIVTGDQESFIRKKVNFLAALDKTLGEQKIDVVLYRDGKSGIERTAMETGELL